MSTANGRLNNTPAKPKKVAISPIPQGPRVWVFTRTDEETELTLEQSVESWMLNTTYTCQGTIPILLDGKLVSVRVIVKEVAPPRALK